MKQQKGFTLIELLIVVAIIGILAAIAVPNFLNAQVRAKIARVRADVRSLSTALQSYYVDHNTYIPDFGGPDVEDRSWKFLTTPISYISGLESARDPFTANSGAESGGVGSFGGVRTYYDYGGGIWHNNSEEQNQQRLQFYMNNRLGFVILSFGPDRKREFPWNDAALRAIGHQTQEGNQYIYNPSNGLNSAGDVIATMGGPLGQ